MFSNGVWLWIADSVFIQGQAWLWIAESVFILGWALPRLVTQKSDFKKEKK